MTQALANCPDESFRRQLYLDHGSLSLASADFELANQAFVAGRDSVKTLGGRVDLRGFENPTAVSPSSVSAVLINALPHHFSKARNMMLMDLDNGEDWEGKLESNKGEGNPLIKHNLTIGVFALCVRACAQWPRNNGLQR